MGTLKINHNHQECERLIISSVIAGFCVISLVCVFQLHLKITSWQKNLSRWDYKIQHAVIVLVSTEMGRKSRDKYMLERVLISTNKVLGFSTKKVLVASSANIS